MSCYCHVVLAAQDLWCLPAMRGIPSQWAVLAAMLVAAMLAPTNALTCAQGMYLDTASGTCKSCAIANCATSSLKLCPVAGLQGPPAG